MRSSSSASRRASRSTRARSTSICSRLSSRPRAARRAARLSRPTARRVSPRRPGDTLSAASATGAVRSATSTWRRARVTSRRGFFAFAAALASAGLARRLRRLDARLERLEQVDRRSRRLLGLARRRQLLALQLRLEQRPQVAAVGARQRRRVERRREAVDDLVGELELGLLHLGCPRPPRRSPRRSRRPRRGTASRARARRPARARGRATRGPSARSGRAHRCRSPASPRAAAGTAGAARPSPRERGSRCGRARSGRPPRRARTARSRSIASRRGASSASSSASSTTTNWPFDASQPFTISSGASSRSCLGHQRFCLIGVRHSRCSSRNETSDWRAAGFVAGARPTGMLTSPKVRDPFQVVRMTPRRFGNDLILPGFRRSCTAYTIDSPAVEPRTRTIARLWRDAVARNARRRRLSRPARRPLARGQLGRGGRARREHGQRPARPGRPQGRGVRDARAHDARVVAVRLRAGPGRRRRRPRLREQLAPRTSPTSSTTRSRSACSARTPTQVAKVEERARLAAAPSARADVRRSGRARGRGRTLQGASTRTALDDAIAAVDEDDLFTFIYTSGTTGPAEGLHDQPPQLLRDGRR